jgi:hypothetical protein
MVYDGARFNWDFLRAGKTGPALVEIRPHKELVSESAVRAGRGDSANAEQFAAQRGVTQLIEYVRVAGADGLAQSQSG